MTEIHTKQQLNVPAVSTVVPLHTVVFTFVDLLPSRDCHLESNAEHQVQILPTDFFFCLKLQNNYKQVNENSTVGTAQS